MPRNKDGSFSPLYSWVDDSKRGIRVQASRFDDQDKDIAKGIQNSIDVNGTNKMLASLDLNTQRVINVGDPQNATDVVNLQTLIASAGAIPLLEDGSDADKGIIKLKHVYKQVGNLKAGDVIQFTAPFTYAKAKDNKAYETIEIDSLSYKVGRVDYVSGKDDRPTFLEGQTYKLELIMHPTRKNLEFITADNNPLSMIITMYQTSYTPAGYIDLAYNYPGLPPLGTYPFIASHTGSDYNSSHKAMIPKLKSKDTETDYNDRAYQPYKGDNKDSVHVPNIAYMNNANRPKDVYLHPDVKNVDIGNDNYPAHIRLRKLLKVF